MDLILDKLAAGQPIQDILEGYPQLTEADIRACMQFGASSIRNDVDLPYAS